MLGFLAKSLRPAPLALLSLYKTIVKSHHSSRQLLKVAKDKPTPFLNSPGHKYKVDQAYALSPEEVKQGKYGIPMGLGLFAFIMYFAFVREYGEKDQAIMEYLNKDISDKIPGEKMRRIRQQVDEEKKVVDRNL
jgi:hypothetical protein